MIYSLSKSFNSDSYKPFMRDTVKNEPDLNDLTHWNDLKNAFYCYSVPSEPSSASSATSAISTVRLPSKISTPSMVSFTKPSIEAMTS